VTEEAAQRAGPVRQPYDEPALAQARWNLVVLCAAVVVLLATMLVARAELATLEASIFRAVNDLPQGLLTKGGGRSGDGRALGSPRSRSADR
jgi:hypothetical protein